jgi:predicted transcriptional regulator
MTVPLHPKEKELLEAADTLRVTVQDSEEFATAVHDALDDLAAGESVDSTPGLTFSSYEELTSTFTPQVLALIEAIRREEPASINAAARVVDRDVKNVHDELKRLEQLGVIYFEDEGQAKRPVVWFDELVISLPVGLSDQESPGQAPA